MFTGLIREIGIVKNRHNNVLTIQSGIKPKKGDSIALNGVCLTVVDLYDGGFMLELGNETRKLIPPEKFQGKVHLEPAMIMGDRFEGHIVQGHIDTIGTIKNIDAKENTVDMCISVDASVMPVIIHKGSIAIDGISLTINSTGKDWFKLSIIPHTLKNTLLGELKTGDKVNIETDLFARYIDRILRKRFGNTSETLLSWSAVDAINMSF